jgi:alcohol dehydrogenase class IV
MPERDLSPETLFATAGASDTPAWVRAFKHAPGTRVHFRPGAVAETGQHAREMGVARVLVVTDPGIELAGHLGKVLGSLRQAGIHAHVFDHVIENPTTDTVDVCVAAARTAKVDGLIGLGGGSSMDTAKGCNFLLTNGGRMRDYWGIGKATRPMLPLLVIPTTSGTGSECQSFALISDAVTHEKMACGDKKAAARHAILDPELTLTQPARVTADTGIDAIAHAIESAVSRKHTETSLAYSRAAFRLLAAGFPAVISTPDSLPSRALMQLGAALAGTAIENSMLGAAHSAANPLTARFDLVHGVAVGVMLPHVVRLNATAPDVAAIYRELAPQADLPSQLTQWLGSAGLPTTLRACGVPEDAIPRLAAEAASQWTAQFNPTPVGAPEFEMLYRAAF